MTEDECFNSGRLTCNKLCYPLYLCVYRLMPKEKDIRRGLEYRVCMNDIDQAKHTMLTRVSLLNNFFQMKKGTTGYRIKNYDEKVLAILDDEYRKQYENTDDIDDKYMILLKCLLNIPPILSAIDKRECKQVLTYKIPQFENHLKNQGYKNIATIIVKECPL
jgi:hypothetical protein